MILFQTLMWLCLAFSLYCLVFVVGGIVSVAVMWPFQKARELWARIFSGHHRPGERIR
jgi:hypothetical protein